MNELTPDMRVWKGRVDEADGPRALRWHQKVQPLKLDSPPGIVLIGFACDEGIRRNQGRVGAAEGPKTIRRVLANHAWHHSLPIYDAGDLFCSSGNLEEAQSRLGEIVKAMLAAGHRPLVLGGGHETAWGTYQGIAGAQPKSVVGVINLDAHLDLRGNEPGNSGTPFAQMARLCQELGREFHYLCLGVSQASNTPALFDRAKLLDTRIVLDRDVVPWKSRQLEDEISNFLKQVEIVHLSIDLDVLPAATMPAVSAVAGRGVSLDAIELLIGIVLGSRKVVAVDLVEYSPALDTDERGARVAARLAWQIAMDWSNWSD